MALTDTDHRARPDDDPRPGDRCKDCGQEITWMGPSMYDWEHVTEHYPTMAGCICGWKSPAIEGEHVCRNGHFDCANAEEGACANEWAAAAFERHQKEAP